MDELKLLIEMVANLPTLAIWVLVGYLAYKLAVVGSIYGIVRFGIEKLHNWLVTPKHKLEKINVEAKLRSMTIENCHEDLIAQIERLKGIHSIDKSVVWNTYIHKLDIDTLRKLIDDYLKARE